MFTVSGVDREDIAYVVEIGPEVVDLPSHWGLVAGPTSILALLAQREGYPLMVTPTGPLITVKRDDPASLLGALYVLTTVVDVEGDAPQVIPPLPEGTVG